MILLYRNSYEMSIAINIANRNPTVSAISGISIIPHFILSPICKQRNFKKSVGAGLRLAHIWFKKAD